MYYKKKKMVITQEVGYCADFSQLLKVNNNKYLLIWNKVQLHFSKMNSRYVIFLATAGSVKRSSARVFFATILMFQLKTETT